MAVSLSPSCGLTFHTQHHHRLSWQRNSEFHKLPFPNQTLSLKTHGFPTLSCYSFKTTIPVFTTAASSSSDSEVEEEEEREAELSPSTSSGAGMAPPVMKKRKRYRKEYPGESKGITEEMRFVAMKLRNNQGSRSSGDGALCGDDDSVTVDSNGTWEPTMEGFLKYLVDSKLVFDTLERVVEDSNDVSYAYFRRTGLERSNRLARDLEWFRQQNVAIPKPSNPGLSYATYLKEIAEKSAPLFLTHFYNAYFSHIAGGQVIAKQVAEKLLDGRPLEFYKWDGDAQELLTEVREKLNRLGEHWSRDDKNKCLKDATKSFRFMGLIVRLIIL